MVDQPDTDLSCSKWVKTNLLGAVPIIGHFFTKDTRAEALEHAGRETAALTASTLLMLFHVTEDQESTLPLFLILAGKMGLGMFAGRAIYNSGLGFYKKCMGRDDETLVLPLLEGTEPS